MKFTALKNYVFYPDINCNLDLPESERLSVEIIRPTGEDLGTLMTIEVAEKRYKDDADRNIFKFNAPKILRRHVGEIKNLIVEDADGKDKKITTGEELADASFQNMYPLITAICSEVCSDKIDGTQKKISKQASDSSGTDGTKENQTPATIMKK